MNVAILAGLGTRLSEEIDASGLSRWSRWAVKP
jgi:hypothetical protein